MIQQPDGHDQQSQNRQCDQANCTSIDSAASVVPYAIEFRKIAAFLLSVLRAEQSLCRLAVKLQCVWLIHTCTKGSGFCIACSVFSIRCAKRMFNMSFMYEAVWPFMLLVAPAFVWSLQEPPHLPCLKASFPSRCLALMLFADVAMMEMEFC